MSRYAARRDANHGDIVKAFLALGCSVGEMDKAGKAGWPDLVVGCLGISHLVEVKNPETGYGRKGLSEGQQQFADSWRGSPVHVVRTVDDCAALHAQWRREFGFHAGGYVPAGAIA